MKLSVNTAYTKCCNISIILTESWRSRAKCHLGHVSVHRKRLARPSHLPGDLLHQLLPVATDRYQRALRSDDHASVAPGQRGAHVEGIATRSQACHPPGRRCRRCVCLALAAHTGKFIKVPIPDPLLQLSNLYSWYYCWSRWIFTMQTVYLNSSFRSYLMLWPTPAPASTPFSTRFSLRTFARPSTR